MNVKEENPFAQIDERFNQLEGILIDLKKTVSQKPATADPHERLTRADIKKLYKVSFGTIHSAMNSGKLSYDKVGRKTLYKRVDVENWINKKA